MSQARVRRRAAIDAESEPADTWFVGLDEAGYGPSLGPLVVVATAFRGPRSLIARDWWKVLRCCFGRHGSNAPVIIDDSKVVHAGPNGRGRLAESAERLLALAGIVSRDLADLIRSMAESDLGALNQEHWFAADAVRDDRLRDPVDGPVRSLCSPEVGPLVERLARAGVSVCAPSARLLFPLAFNERLEKGNKADIELALVVDLLRRQLAAADPGCQRIVILVDRLGGRRYYRPLVEDLAGDAFVFSIEEAAARSVYRYESAGREVEVRFCVNGDRLHLPIAASSILAKHLRECCMENFNAFWAAQSPGLARTSGYHADASRFFSEIEPLLAGLSLSSRALWRER